jgi:hypothetical protein
MISLAIGTLPLGQKWRISAVCGGCGRSAFIGRL